MNTDDYKAADILRIPNTMECWLKEHGRKIKRVPLKYEGM
jgi:hypothetical protein